MPTHNNNFTEKANFLWSIADLIRDVFRRSKYQDVILPLTVLRRIDCVLEPTKNAVLKAYAKYNGQIPNLDPTLRNASGYVFYNTSPYTFERLVEDPSNLAANLLAYINAFSENMREVIEKFDFRNTIAKLDESGLLFLVMERFKNIDLHPDKVDNHEMGTIFEELIRRFNEALDENPGEHFTPREVIHLMVDLLVGPENGKLTDKYRVIKVADPACGSGGMLTIAKERLLERNPTLQVHIYGQEINPETFAMCKSDLYMKSADGKDAENIVFGSSLSHEANPNERFDYQLANPPYGKEWKMDEAEVKAEASKPNGRFSAGLPRISDGQILFLQHMLSRMNPPDQGGGRVAIVMNGSPLFTGDAGSGESEIRRWILENDWLEAIVALPEQLFYNTGIATYVWVLNNRKTEKRKGKMQLINATGIWTPMRKSMGNKRRQITPTQIKEIYQLFERFEEGARSKIFDSTDFGYRKVTIERPLRLDFQVSPERITRLKEHPAFMGLAQSKKKELQTRLFEEEDGRKRQEEILAMLARMPQELFTSRPPFEKTLDHACKKIGLKLDAPLRKAILAALSERNETADICMDKDGSPEPDPDLRDTENVPLKEDIDQYLVQVVKPHIPDAWVNSSLVDHKDRNLGQVGYEINFNRYFFEHQSQRKLEKIEEEIKVLQNEILEILLNLGIKRADSRLQQTKEQWHSYPTYRESGIEWLGKIPSNWQIIRIKQLAHNRNDVVQTGPFGAQLHASDYVEEGIPLILIKNVNNLRIDDTDIPKISKEKANDLAIYKLEKGDIVFSRVGSIGRIALVSEREEGWLISGQMLRMRLRADDQIDDRYSVYALSCDEILHFIELKSVGSTRESINTDILRNLPIILPSITEQHAIVDFLDSEIARIDAVVMKTEEINEKLREYRSTLISSVITGKIDVTN